LTANNKYLKLITIKPPSMESFEGSSSICLAGCLHVNTALGGIPVQFDMQDVDVLPALLHDGINHALRARRPVNRKIVQVNDSKRVNRSTGYLSGTNICRILRH